MTQNMHVTPPTAEQWATLIAGARKGLSFTGCAQLISRSREWLKRARKQDDRLDAAMCEAHSQYEAEMMERRNAALEDGDAALVNAKIGRAHV